MNAQPSHPTLVPVWILALVWGVLPAVPSLLEGQLLGQPYTDLYPSVWGTWVAAEAAPAVVTSTTLLAWPEGMGFYFSSPIKGLLAALLLPWLGLPATWNVLVIAARVATVGLAGHAARAWGLQTAGALTVAGAWGCSAVFQGYAVEGIVEGTDGWPLALWAWAVAKDKRWVAVLSLALCVGASWYLGAVACLLAVFAGLRHRAGWWSLAGIGLALPAVLAFAGAFGGGPPLDASVRAAMGAHLRIPTPGVTEGLNPFAITAYFGFILMAMSVFARQRWALLALIPAVLSLGEGPWYALPVLSALRFPYRWHLATLAVASLAAGTWADRFAGKRGWLFGPLIVIEVVLLSPIEPLIPGAEARVPALYDKVTGVVVDVPGPVALPPGEVNLSRPRARWFQYAQTVHGQPTIWVLDFNSVGAHGAPNPIRESVFADLRRYDRVAGGTGEGDVPSDLVVRLRSLDVTHLVLHRKIPGAVGIARLRAGLEAQGAVIEDDDGERWLMRLP